jgi:hypothetical protein
MDLTFDFDNLTPPPPQIHLISQFETLAFCLWVVLEDTSLIAIHSFFQTVMFF